MITAILWGLCSAIIGVAVVSVFGTDPSPLQWYFRWAGRWHEHRDWRAWIASPIGGCVVCTSGQLGLWSFSLIRPWGWHRSFDWAWGEMPTMELAVDGMSTFLHLLAGCSAVLCAFIINRAYKWMESRM